VERPDNPIECPSSSVPIGIGGIVLGAAAASAGRYVLATPTSCDPARSDECGMISSSNTVRAGLIGIPLILGGVALGAAGAGVLARSHSCRELKQLQGKCLQGDTQACAAMNLP
jgi:hypothetical protein